MGTKTISKDDNYTFYITKGSDMVYQFSDVKTARGSYIDFYIKGDDFEDYSFARNGDDLVIVSYFGFDEQRKYSTTIVKDYYKIAPEVHKHFVYLDNDNVYNYVISSNIASFANGKFTDTPNVVDIYGDKKNTTYNIMNASKGAAIYDLGGNDTYYVKVKYNSDAGNSINIDDVYGGNDKYVLTNGSNTYIEDYKGNDVYHASHTNNSDINDFKGNDSYTLSRVDDSDINDYEGNDKYYATYSEVWIDDEKGNDVYDIESSYLNSEDYLGNDKYTLNNVNGYLYDYAGNNTFNLSMVDCLDLYGSYEYAGNDKYNIRSGFDLELIDYGGKDSYAISNFNQLTVKDSYGSDTYTLADVSNEGYDDKYGIFEYGGDDKYSLSFVDNFRVVDNDGKDSYTVNDSERLTILDNYGNDSFKVTSSVGTTINDTDGADKYTFTNCFSIAVTDYSGNDNYTLTDVNQTGLGYAIYDSNGADKYTITSSSIGLGIMDTDGDDKYTIKDGSYAMITDTANSNDSYTIDKLTGQIAISDNNGSKDSLTISGLSSKNAIIMANFNKNGGGKVNDSSMFIFDSTQNGFVEIRNYFTTTSGYLNPYSEGVGKIETIKAGSKSLESNISDFRYESDYISSQVASWLNNNTSYASVSELVSYGTSAEVASFIIAAGEWQGGGVLM